MSLSDKVVIEAEAGQSDIEDSGEARILHIESDDDDVFFIRLHSYDEERVHETIKHFEGKRLRITVEII